MRLFRKKADPISHRARALNSEIAALEAQIRRYESKLERGAAAPSKDPFGGDDRSENRDARGAVRQHRELELAEVHHRRLTSNPLSDRETLHINELGVRKYDLPGLIARVKDFFRAPTTSNPKLVSYLAAGGIQGLRPLRYEKRVARNRFIVFVGILFLLLLGILMAFVPR